MTQFGRDLAIPARLPRVHQFGAVSASFADAFDLFVDLRIL
jgi:hypothetical protein